MVDKHEAGDTGQPRRKALEAARVREGLEESARIKILVAQQCTGQILAVVDHIYRSLAEGGKVMLCGNGGSAADAQHLAAELLVRLRPHVNRPGIPAIALAMDASSMTACGNDYSYALFYQRMVETLGQPGDVLLGISTSGNSENVRLALEAARSRGIVAIGLLGRGGGPCLASCDTSIVVPSDITAHIQESHIAIGHLVMELIEDRLMAGGLKLDGESE